MTISGHASVFDTPYTLWGFDEQVARGAFKKSIREADVAALWNHDPNVVLGRKKSGTLRMAEDDRGLHYEVDLPDTQAARDLYTLIQRGDVYQSSFAFEVVKESWDYPKGEDKGLPLRTLREVRLYDVSPVTYPASPSTDVDVARAVRSFAEALGIDASTAESVPDVWELAQTRDAATEEPEAEPLEEHSEPTLEPEPARHTYYSPGM
jgi:HK97 family phage prohead protease